MLRICPHPGSLFLPLIFFVGSTALAQASDKPLEISIPAGNLANSLEKLGEQSGLQIMYEPAVASDIKVAAVSGRLTVSDALTQLLAQTGLQADRVNDKTVVLKRAETAPVKKEQDQPSTANSPPQEPSEALEEIVVTSQKRLERLQNVPISISVLTGPGLDASPVQGVTEALSRVPGTAANVTYQGGGTQLVMRGVTAGGALFNGSSPIAYYIDSVPFGFVRSAVVPDSNAYDLERVEVLRGPQGTLYGASAQNGVVRVLTADANASEFEIKARTSVSTTQGGGESYRGDMAVNVPIVDAKLAVRAVLGYQNLGGWIDRSGNEDVNDGDVRNLRFKVKAQPFESLTVDLSTWLSRAEYGAPSTSNDSATQVAELDEPMDTDFDMYGLKVGYDFAAFRFSSMTSYLDYHNQSYRDLGVYFSFPGLKTDELFESEVISQEFVLNSASEGSWRWSIGGMYRDAEDLQYQSNLLDGELLSVDVNDTYESRSAAVFGELTRVLMGGHLELTAGLRYFEDEVTLRENSNDAGLPLIRTQDNFDAVSPRLVATWLPSARATFYASYAEGFRSGFPQRALISRIAPEFPPADSDKLKNYEIGAKGSAADGRLLFDTAVYYIDWNDVQQSLTIPYQGLPRTVNINGAAASGIGIDMSVTAQATDRLDVGGGFSWNDLTMDTEVISAGELLFEKGDRLNVSPEWTASGWAGYSFPLVQADWEGRLSLSLNYTSEMDLRTIASGEQYIAPGDPMLIGRASFSVKSPGHWVTTLFVDNINNESGSPVRLPFVPGVIMDWDTRVRPRTYGAQLEYRF